MRDYSPNVLSDLARVTAERDAAVAALAYVQTLPELEWAEVSSSLMMRLSALARGGNGDEARALLAVLDKGKTYVTRVTAERDALRAEVEAMRRCVAALRNHGEARNEGEAQDALDDLDALGEVR